VAFGNSNLPNRSCNELKQYRSKNYTKETGKTSNRLMLLGKFIYLQHQRRRKRAMGSTFIRWKTPRPTLAKELTQGPCSCSYRDYSLNQGFVQVLRLREKTPVNCTHKEEVTPSCYLITQWGGQKPSMPTVSFKKERMKAGSIQCKISFLIIGKINRRSLKKQSFSKVVKVPFFNNKSLIYVVQLIKFTN